VARTVAGSTRSQVRDCDGSLRVFGAPTGAIFGLALACAALAANVAKLDRTQSRMNDRSTSWT